MANSSSRSLRSSTERSSASEDSDAHEHLPSDGVEVTLRAPAARRRGPDDTSDRGGTHHRPEGNRWGGPGNPGAGHPIQPGRGCRERHATRPCRVSAVQRSAWPPRHVGLERAEVVGQLHQPLGPLEAGRPGGAAAAAAPRWPPRTASGNLAGWARGQRDHRRRRRRGVAPGRAQAHRGVGVHQHPGGRVHLGDHGAGLVVVEPRRPEHRVQLGLLVGLDVEAARGPEAHASARR